MQRLFPYCFFMAIWGETPLESKWWDRQQHEWVVVCESLVRDRSTAGSIRSRARRGRTVPGLSQGQCTALSPWHLPASEWHGAQAGHDLPALRSVSASPFLHWGCPAVSTSAHGFSRLGIQFTVLFVSLFFRDRVGHRGRCSECFLNFAAS